MWAKLNLDIIALICAGLRARHVLLSVRLVCRSWTASCGAWPLLEFSDLAQNIYVSGAVEWLDMRRGLEDQVSQSSNVQEIIARKLPAVDQLSLLASLTSLEITEGQVDGLHLEKLRQLPLKDLYLGDFSKCASLESLPAGLQTLALFKCSADMNLQQLAPLALTLHTLKLDFSWTPEAIEVVVRSSPALETLLITDLDSKPCVLGGNAFAPLQRLRSLQSLDIHLTRYEVEDADLLQIGQCTRLDTLAVEPCCLSNLSVLFKITGLAQLTLMHCTSELDLSALAFLSLLTHLRLERCSTLMCLPYLPNLIELRLGESDLSLAKHQQTLAPWNVPCLHLQRSVNVNLLLKHFIGPATREVFLYPGTRSALRELARCPNLQLLSIPDTMSRRALNAVFNLRKLTELELDASSVNQVDFDRLCKALTCLQILSLDASRIANLTELKNLVALRWLTLWNTSWTKTQVWNLLPWVDDLTFE